MAQFFNEVLNWLAGIVGLSVGADSWLGYIAAAAVHIGLLIQVVAVGALIFIWMERKIAGRIQDRLGPTRVGGKFGWLQTLADGVKLVAKEDVTPKDADRLLFKLAPYVSFAASFTGYMALPFAFGWAAQEVNVAVFFIVAVLGLEVFGVILAGYASGSKWSLFGGMREAAQVVSYEVPMGLCIVVPVLLVGSMNLVTIGEAQAGLFTNWLILHDPFTFLIFWVYFTCAIASVNRAPFDLAEAESELVAGFHTEYSGLRWSFFFMAEYGSMFLVSGLAAVLFFGGWNGPIPIFHLLPAIPGLEGGPSGHWAYEQGETTWRLLGLISNIAGVHNLILKAVVGVTVMMWIRWTLPRLRIDQVMTVCLKYCVPLAAFFFIGVVLWKLYIPWFSPNAIAPLQGRHLAEVRESWVLEPNAVGEVPPAKAAPANPPVKPAHPASASGEPVAVAPVGREVQP